ncbi:hypothetical protein BN961_03885 [Afipia felis]|uniref:Uncharacterized protein n=1 Tax=Afipia felis TaxID=1035 RepID=A0A090MSX6_AFIFE|nr:prevent-host-death protein [Afipia felis]CEG10445.1 hypothetical protein BN961_03885 [Afipia felis]
MGGPAKQNHTPPAPTDEASATGHDRRAVRTVDLTGEEIAAIEASEMAPGFEQLDAELEPKSTALTEEGARFAQKLG